MLADAFSEVDCARKSAIFVNGLASSVISLAFLLMPHHIHPPLLLFVNCLQKKVRRSMLPASCVIADKEFLLFVFIDSTNRYFQTLSSIFLILPSLLTHQSTWPVPDPFIA